MRQCRALAGALANASLEIDEWLSTRELAAVVRTAYDPDEAPAIESRAARARALRYDGTPAGIDPALAGPAAAHNQWSTYRHDGAFSAAFHIGDWPMTQVYANFLLPMLGETATHRRSLSLHIEPLPPRTAQRLIGRERTARNVQTRLRVRTGQIIPEHEREADLRAHQQDAERAAGHGVARLTGYMVVTVTDPEDLEAAVAAVRADADTARIELRRMYGVQDVGFVLGALPFGMGLPKKGRGMRQRGTASTKLRGIDAATLLGPATRPPEAAALVNEPRRTTSSAATRYSPRLGWNWPFGGRSAPVPQPASIRASTAQIQGLYPVAARENPSARRRLRRRGRAQLQRVRLPSDRVAAPRTGDQPQHPDHRDPRRRQVRRSIKALSLRLMAYGITPLMLETSKTNTHHLCKALGVEPVELGPGLPARLNPLDAGPLGAQSPRRSAAAARTPGRDPPAAPALLGRATGDAPAPRS